LDNSFLVGFCDGEATFSVGVLKHKKLKIGWTVLARFSICLHKKDLVLLKHIQSCLGGIGSIYIKETQGTVYFTVGSVGDLVNVIIRFL
jgi:hypothetical protein